MNRDACSGKTRWAWRAPMFREFFTEEESSIANAIFAVHHTPVGHVEQNEWSNTKHIGVKRNRLCCISDTEIRNEREVLK